MQVTDELRVLVEAEVERAIDNMQKFDRAMGASEKEAATLGSALTAMESKALLMSGAIVVAGGGAIKFAADNESLKTSLEVLLKSADKANAIFSEWQTLGAKTPLNMDEIGKAGKSLLAFNVSANEVTDTLRRIGDIATGTGSSIGEIAEIYGKAKVQGRLFAEDINQLQGRGIPVVQELAKMYGVTESEIKKMVEAGKIGFPDVEKAFKSLTDEGGLFHNMMEKLSEKTIGKFSTAVDNGKQALVSFGDIMLPMANDVIDFASSTFTAISDMDEGTKRFLLGMGTVVAIAGPTIASINGINKAFKALSANPYTLAITASIAGISILTGIIAKQANAYDDLTTKIKNNNTEAQSMLTAYAGGNQQKELDKDTTEKLIKLYPELTGLLKSYGVEVGTAADAVKMLNRQKMEDANNKELERLKEKAAAIADYKNQYAQAAKELQDYYDRVASGEQQPMQSEQVERYKSNIEETKSYIGDLQGTYNDYFKNMNASLSNLGYQLTDDLHIIEIPVTLAPKVVTTNSGSDSAIRSWQSWFEEISKVSKKMFGDSGSKAGQLYIANLEDALGDSKRVSEMIGESFDMAGALEGQRDAIKKALNDMFAIDPSTINVPFEKMDASTQTLLTKLGLVNQDLSQLYNQKTISDVMGDLATKLYEVGQSEDALTIAKLKDANATKEQLEAAHNLMNEYTVLSVLDAYKDKVDSIGKSEYDLAMAKITSSGATADQVLELSKYIEMLKKAEEKTESFQEYFEKNFSTGVLGVFPKLSKEASDACASIAYQMANISFSGILDGLSDVGYAFAQESDSAEAFQAAMANMMLKILDALPMLFVQAGLQLIVSGQYALGLGFIFGGMASSLVAGYVSGKIDSASGKNKLDDTSTSSASAQGNVFSNTSLVPFAHGSSFAPLSAYTNSVVSSPTAFRYANGAGLMGEGGDSEGILPLKRLANGDLGVQANGGASSASVYINIINNTGAEVSKKETTTEDGSRQFEIMIGKAVAGTISSGNADNALRTRFGLKTVGL